MMTTAMRRNLTLTMPVFPPVSKARKPKFELTLKIIDLNNVPLVSGTSFVKWHLPSSTSAEHRGRTSKEMVSEHKVTWDYTNTIPVKMSMDKANNLQELIISFEIVQDYGSGAGRSEKITLGVVQLNLAEYVDFADDGEEGVMRRYLMQESKVNSTVKLGINMKHVEGTRDYVAPPLKTAPVFGGIAGIMGNDQVEDELGNVPTANRTREVGELQDMYRKSLAAYWAAQAGELPADKCIEDIFEGGDGWKSKYKQDAIPIARERLDPGHQADSRDDYERWHQDQQSQSHRRNFSSGTSNSNVITTRVIDDGAHNYLNADDPSLGMQGQSHRAMMHKNNRRKHDNGQGHHRSRSRFEDHQGVRHQGFRNPKEVNEFAVRDDLMSWRLPGEKTAT